MTSFQKRRTGVQTTVIWGIFKAKWGEKGREGVKKFENCDDVIFG